MPRARGLATFTADRGELHGRENAWEALAHYHRALSAQRGVAVVLSNLAQALIKLARFPEAALAAGASLQLVPGASKSIRRYICALEALGCPTAARAMAARLPRKEAATLPEPPAASAEAERAVLRGLLARFPAVLPADAQLKSAPSPAPDSVEAWKALGNSLFTAGDSESSAVCYVQALRCPAATAVGDVLNNSALCLLHGRSWEAAAAAAAAAGIFFAPGDAKNVRARLRHAEAVAQLGVEVCTAGMCARALRGPAAKRRRCRRTGF